jgi:hypothetical protein
VLFDNASVKKEKNVNKKERDRAAFIVLQIVGLKRILK